MCPGSPCPLIKTDMDLFATAALTEPSPPTVVRTVVRLSTQCWQDDRGVNITRRVRWLKRQSREQSVTEDVDGGGAREFIGRIVNLSETPDGVYVLRPVNLCSDWETGIIEDWDYRLEPLEPPTETA